MNSKVSKIIYGILFGCLLITLLIQCLFYKTINSGVFFVVSIIILIATCALMFFNFKDRGGELKFLKNSKNEFFAVSIVILIACLLRFVNLSTIPNGMMADEWSMLYESWSLANYGVDRNGNSLPVYLVSWGSGQNALLIYLTIPFVKIFGMTVFSARIVMAICSIITIIATYFLVKKITNKETAFIMLLLLTFLPWNLMLSRWGLESNLLPCFLALGMLFLVKSLKDNHWYFILSCFFFGISLYSYALDFVFLPIFLVVCYVFMIIKKKIKWKSFILGNLILFCLALPLILFLLVNINIIEPFKLFNVFSISKLAGFRPGADGNFNILSNIHNFFRIFVIQNDNLYWNTISPFGFAFFMSTPFSMVGIVNICKNIKSEYTKNFDKFLMTIWLFCGILSSFIMSASSLNHFNCLLIPYYFTIAQGIVDTAKSSKIFYSILSVLYAIMFTMFSCVYFSNGRKEESYDIYSQDLFVATQFAESIKQEGDTIVLINESNYIITLCANKISPIDFSETVEWEGVGLRGVKSYKGYLFTDEYVGNENSVYIIKNDTSILPNKNEWQIKTFGNYCVFYV